MGRDGTGRDGRVQSTSLIAELEKFPLWMENSKALTDAIGEIGSSVRNALAVETHVGRGEQKEQQAQGGNGSI